MNRREREALDRHITGDEADYWGSDDDVTLLKQAVNDMHEVIILQGKQLVALSLQLYNNNERLIKMETKVNELLLNKANKTSYDDEVF